MPPSTRIHIKARVRSYCSRQHDCSRCLYPSIIPPDLSQHRNVETVLNPGILSIAVAFDPDEQFVLTSLAANLHGGDRTSAINDAFERCWMHVL